ncbi:MAG: bacillithiol system redox-active protein YtxJ [Lutibacter sp.]|nr:bacillithiol system redox-active protein YtxJ [Lutibacter sp.]
MSLIDRLFKGNTISENNKQLDWIDLTNESQLSSLIVESSDKPVLIFKHSTRCGVSRMALKSFEKNYDIDSSEVKLYFLDLLKFRKLSNEISYKLNIIHQSPQVIVVRDKKVVYHDSHYGISVSSIKRVLD